jgi:hypothetical protein
MRVAHTRMLSILDRVTSDLWIFAILPTMIRKWRTIVFDPDTINEHWRLHNMTDDTQQTEAAAPFPEIDWTVTRFSKSPSGKWRIAGPASEVVAGGNVNVTTKSGEIRVYACRGVGEVFERTAPDGSTIECRYGYSSPSPE